MVSLMRYGRLLAGSMAKASIRVLILTVAAIGGLFAIEILPPQEAGNALFYWWAAQTAVLALVYGWRSPWYKSDMGRAFMYQTLSMAVIGLQGTFALLWPGYPLRLDVRQALFLALVISSLNVLIMVIRIQNAAKSRR
jgi:hypothetical protein